MEKVSFGEKVYSLCCSVPKGKVTTYRQIAEALGMKGYRAVGQALRCNPYAPIVPCHRVIASNGSLQGFKGKRSGKEVMEKETLLKNEGVEVVDGRVNMEKYVHKF